ncbi:MAG: PPOX class F420-dependent oxidoreductase [Chloroflexi bacterium]|nr:PPOX class F420-dependent oxidoreductase [Chloroflexota bacterium]
MAFPRLHRNRYMNLTTFRKNGAAVPTTVWFAADAEQGDKLYVMTAAHAGKVKRIRRNAQVEVAPATMRGHALDAAQEAMARILPDGEARHADRALNRKYTWQKWIFDAVARMRGYERVYLEITPM